MVDDLDTGSAIATFRGADSDAEMVNKVSRLYLEVGRALSRGELSANVFQARDIREAAQKIRGIIDGRVHSVRFETADDDVTVLAGAPSDLPELPPKLKLSSNVDSFGAVLGRVQTVSNRGSLRFTLYDLLHDRAVSCYLHEGQQEMMREMWDKIALVKGWVKREPNTGRPISVRRVREILPREEGHPGDWRRAEGILKGRRLDDELPEVTIRRLRDVGWGRAFVLGFVFFLSYLNGQEDRVPEIRALLSEADRRERSIVTSTYTVAEVAFAALEKANGIDPAIEDAIDSLWRPPSPVAMAEFHMGIAEEARSLMRQAIQHGWKLKPGDAIHLASAVDVGAQALVTYDLSDFKRWESVVGLRVEPPSATQLELA